LTYTIPYDNFFKNNNALVAWRLPLTFLDHGENMDENEKTAPQKPVSDKKLRLDLSEALHQGLDDDDDIIELKDEVTPQPKVEKAKIDQDEQATEDLAGDEKAEKTISRLDAPDREADAAENGGHLVDDLVFEEEDENKENADHPAESLIFEEEDEDQAKILPLVDEEESLEANAADEVEEITEFDDILSADSNEMMTLSDVADESEDEDEFLELIDVEEDSLPSEDKGMEMADESVREDIEDDIIQFDGPAADVEDTELEDFINDSLGEEIQVDDDFEDDLTNALGIEAESDINLESPSSGTEEFDFEMDSSEISRKINQLEANFSDESEAEDNLDETDETETETTGSVLSESGDETDEMSEKFDGLEDIFFDESEIEDELDEDAASEIETAGLAASDAGDQADEISQKIDRLENTFFDESEAEAKLDEDDESEVETVEAAVSETGEETDEKEIETSDVVSPEEPPEEPPADGAIAALAGASQEQIENSIEQIIQQNFSGKIESMVRQTIENAVSKEIDRLKNILLEDDGDEDF
jgi:hypothetical protein